MSFARASLVVGSTLTALAAAGCLVVEPGPLERARMRDGDGGTDVPVIPDDVPSMDDGGGGTVLAERCGQDTAPLLGGTAIYDIDTTDMTDDFEIMGTSMPGHDGFFQFEGVSGQFWHFHLASLTDGRNPVLYVQPAPGPVCPNTNTFTRNECEDTDGDEHFAFRAPSNGRFFLGIDDINPGGGVYRLQVIRPMCGDGIQEHGESCDGGDPGTCTPMCQILLSDISGTGRTMVPPGRHNDTIIEAMVVELDDADPTLEVTGNIPIGDCYPDFFALDVTAGQRVHVSALNRTTSAACGSAAEAEYTLEIQNASGGAVGGGVDGNGCPTVDVVLPTAGRYFIRLNSAADTDRAVPYLLRFERTP